MTNNVKGNTTILSPLLALANDYSAIPNGDWLEIKRIKGFKKKALDGYIVAESKPESTTLPWIRAHAEVRVVAFPRPFRRHDAHLKRVSGSCLRRWLLDMCDVYGDRGARA